MNTNSQPQLNAGLNRFRAFMGLLMNHEEILENCGVNLPASYLFAVEEHDHLEQLQSNVSSDSTESWQSALQEADQNLLQKVSSILAILKIHHSSSHVLGCWLSYRESLRQPAQSGTFFLSLKQSSIQKTGSQDSTSRPADPLDAYNTSWPDLEWLRSNLIALNLPHDFILPFGIFLGGLGQTHFQAKPAERPSSGCSLSSAAQEGLQIAVDFALQEEAQCLARSRSRIPGDTEYQCLLMGVAHLAKNPSPALEPWFHQDNPIRQLTSVLFAMGCLAVSERVSFRWTRLLLPRWQMLTEDSFGPELTKVILKWTQRADKPVTPSS